MSPYHSRCRTCGAVLPEQKGRGRKREFCCQACKDVWHALGRIREHLPGIIARASEQRRLELKGELVRLSAGCNRRDALGRMY